MNIRNSKPVFTTLFAAIALSAASFAGAAESGLSHNEQAAQNAIVDQSTTSTAATTRDARSATLAQNENAAQRVIAVDYAAISLPITVRGEVAALAVNERAAKRAIVDVPPASHAMTKDTSTKPVAVR